MELEWTTLPAVTVVAGETVSSFSRIHRGSGRGVKNRSVEEREEIPSPTIMVGINACSLLQFAAMALRLFIKIHTLRMTERKKARKPSKLLGDLHDAL